MNTACSPLCLLFCGDLRVCTFPAICTWCHGPHVAVPSHPQYTLKFASCQVIVMMRRAGPFTLGPLVLMESVTAGIVSRECAGPPGMCEIVQNVVMEAATDPHTPQVRY